MRHSIHLFIGEEMVSLAETISRHLKIHSSQSEAYAHVACWKNSGGIRTIRVLGDDGYKASMEDDQQGAYYMSGMHDRIINIAVQDHFGDELYMCIYVQLYDETVLDEITKIIAWCKASSKTYLIDVYGLADDVARVFCSGVDEEHELIRNAGAYANTARDYTVKLISCKDVGDINRLLVLQNCNLSGIGLMLDKNTLIKILAEYALLTTEQFSDIFPSSDFSRPDVTAFGISALWFDRYFFTDYLLSHTYLHVMERENVPQRKMENPLNLLVRAKKYISENSSLLSNFYEEFIKPHAINGVDEASFKIDTCSKYKAQLDGLKAVFQNVMSDDSLSLPEKRAMLALFIREDDELLDDNVLLDELPTIDDCFEEALSLYVHEENLYENEGNAPIISGPRKNGQLFLPLAELKARKARVRKSQSFIRRCEKRLNEIKEAKQITEDSRKRLSSEGFTYGETTYQLQHDIVEKPLEKTYTPIPGIQKKSVDLRSSFSAVGNQGRIGSCSAFSILSIFEFIINQVESDKKYKLSPRFLYYNVCRKNDDESPIDSGSSLYDNIESLGRLGACVEEMCPYEEGLRKPSEEAYVDASQRLVTEAKNVEVDHDCMTSALTEGYPIAISLKIFDSFGSDRNGFVFRPTEKELKSTDFGYHAMVICGYSQEKKVYIVRNSWGDHFGDNGYCYIPYSYIEDKSLCRQACIITGVNCNQFVSVSPSDEVINFDEDGYAIEYAITRILKEEEEQNLKHLEEDYNSLNGEYIKLVQELTNLGKRDVLTKHAINRVESVSNSSDEAERNAMTVSIPRFGKEKLAVPICILGLSLLLGYAQGWEVITNIGVGVVASLIVALWMGNATKEETIFDNRKKQVRPCPNPKLAYHLKFLSAGQSIDFMSDFRNDLERKHRYLSSYIGHFSKWYREEQKVFATFEDKLKPPFNTILSKNDFNVVFNLTKDELAKDTWLWNEFEDYVPTEEKVREFQTRLKNSLRTRVDRLHDKFSMSKFMMNSEAYDYLIPSKIKIDRWLSSIESQSVPFVHCMGLNPLTRKIVFVRVSSSSDQEAWNTFIHSYYVSQPACAFGGSPYKLTYVQIQGLSRNQVRYLSNR